MLLTVLRAQSWLMDWHSLARGTIDWNDAGLGVLTIKLSHFTAWHCCLCTTNYWLL